MKDEKDPLRVPFPIRERRREEILFRKIKVIPAEKEKSEEFVMSDNNKKRLNRKEDLVVICDEHGLALPFTLIFKKKDEGMKRDLVEIRVETCLECHSEAFDGGYDGVYSEGYDAGLEEGGEK